MILHREQKHALHEFGLDTALRRQICEFVLHTPWSRTSNLSCQLSGLTFSMGCGRSSGPAFVANFAIAAVLVEDVKED